MFIGHALFAFAVAALVAQSRGWDRRPALLVGVVAGAFAAVPDIDVAYALVGLADAVTGSVGVPTAFWAASREVHRSVTHSLVVGAVAAPAFGLLAARDSSRTWLVRGAGSVLLGVLVAVAFVDSGPLAAFVMGLFAATGGLVAVGVARQTPLSASAIGVAALWGLWSHPWGDLVTGMPPDWFFPFGSSVLESRVVLHSDPTLHLLGAFAIELATIWLALIAVCRLTDRSIVSTVNRRAAVGAAYGVAALAVTPPTLEVSYHFVYSILGVGVLCGTVRGPPTPRIDRLRDRYVRRPSFDGTLEVLLTTMTAVTLALAAYATVYVFVVAPS
ncbi:metal-dependent hydrolase [Natrinema caseinilyticum]|uniref:metal-dependent hydrolase n=1 Tax=Natrinema caseinilyticum TaxID=2961570 RepID=UPI0020C4B412|nr:metal-dependent hydrolase [Natrinema caseinilyticum]